jgi:hypothetical protein
MPGFLTRCPEIGSLHAGCPMTARPLERASHFDAAKFKYSS